MNIKHSQGILQENFKSDFIEDIVSQFRFKRKYMVPGCGLGSC